jgi:ribosomal-protein-serine acetyltransferase
MYLSVLTEEDMIKVNEWLKYPDIKYYVFTEPYNSQLDTVALGIHLNDELIGFASLHNIDYENSKAEYGIALPDKKPTKVAFNATIQILKFAFYELGLNRVYIRPLRSNLNQTKIDQREKFGFIREGIERKSVKRGDIYEDIIVFSILKEEFERRWG